MSSGRSQRSNDQGLCAMCKKLGPLRCQQCQGITYCSRTCQQLDWSIHKLVCKVFKDFSERQRPGQDYIRAIHFPRAEQKPRFLWLQLDCGTPLLDTVLGPPDKDRIFATQLRNHILVRNINKIAIAGKFLEANRTDKILVADINNSMRKINKELTKTWYGEILAYGCHEREAKSCDYYDLTPLDFRYVVDALRSRYDWATRDRERIVQEPSVVGVRIANNSDNNQGACPPIEELRVSATQCSSASDVEAPVCDRIGIPLVLRQLPLSLTGKDRPVGNITQFDESKQIGLNLQLRFLNPSMSMSDERHGVGSAIAVRKDGRPLHKEHMLAFIQYAVSVNDKHLGRELDVCSSEHFFGLVSAMVRAAEGQR